MRVIEMRAPKLANFKDVAAIDVLVDCIEPDTPLVTLETEKATMGVPSTVGGVVERAFGPGETKEIVMTSLELEHALLDPTAAFRAPQDVVRSTELSPAQKLEVLCRWAYDARELAVAEEEGMLGGSGAGDLDAVAAALHSLVGELDGEHTAPTKHGAACLRPRRTDTRSTG